MANPIQPPSFKTDVNRAPTKRWVDAKSYNYDGDDWGSYDEYEDVERPAPPQKPTGLRQRGQSLTTPAETPANPSNLERTTNSVGGRWQPSYDDRDEKRDFSPGTLLPPQRQGDHVDPNSGRPSASNAPQFIQRQALRAPAQNSPLSTQNQDVLVKTGLAAPWSQMSRHNSADNRRPSQSRSSSTTSTSRSSADPLTRRDFSPSALPPPLQTRASPAPPGNNDQGARLPPRKSSLSQLKLPVIPASLQASQAPIAQISSTAEPSAQSSAFAETKAPLFMRPADIYKRLAEEKEKERRSMDSTRPSMDSMGRQTRDGPNLAGGIQTRGNSESPVRDLQRPISRDKSGDRESDSRLKPALEPVAERKSEYGLEKFVVPDPAIDRAAGVIAISHDSQPARSTPTVPSATAPSLPKLNRVSGFGTDLWGFSQPNTEGAPPTTVQDQASTFSPKKKQDTGSAAQPQDRSNVGSTSVVEQAFQGPNARGSPLIHMSGSQRSATGSELSRSGTESTAGISPIMSRVPSAATATKRVQEHGQIPSAPAIAEDVRESGSSYSRPASNSTLLGPSQVSERGTPMHSRNVSAESESPLVNPGYRRGLYSPSPSGSPARTPAIETSRRLTEGTAGEMAVASPIYDSYEHPNNGQDPISDFAAREVDLASAVHSSTERHDTGAAAAAKTAQPTFLQSRSDSLAAADPRLPELNRVGSNTISRSASPGTGKGRVRDLASRYNEIGESRSNSVQSPTSSVSSWSSGNKRSISPEKSMAGRGSDNSIVPRRDNIERSRYGDAPIATRGISQAQDPVVRRPRIPGGWVSEADIASTNASSENRELGDIQETMYGLEGSPHAAEGPRTPTIMTLDEETDFTPTPAKMPPQGGICEPPYGSLATLATADTALTGSLMASTWIAPNEHEAEPNNPASSRYNEHSRTRDFQDRPYDDHSLHPLPTSRESPLAAEVVLPTAPSKDAANVQQSSRAFGYLPPSRLSEDGGRDDKLQYGLHGQQGRGTPTSRVSRDLSSSDSESDRLRKDIVRSLTPVLADNGAAPSRNIQSNGPVPEDSQRDNALRESSVIPREYESYWAGTDSAEGSPGEQHGRHNYESAADAVSSKDVSSPSEYQTRGAQRCADIQPQSSENAPTSSLNPGTSSIDSRFSWEEDNVRHHDQSGAANNPLSSSMVNHFVTTGQTTPEARREFAGSGGIQPLQAHSDPSDDPDKRSHLERGTPEMYNEERSRLDYDEPSMFGGIRPSRFSKEQPAIFHKGEPVRFNEEEPVTFNVQEPVAFNEQEAVTFNVHEPVTFNEHEPVRSNEQVPVIFNEQEPARMHDAVGGNEEAPRVVSPASWSNPSSLSEHPNQYNRNNTSTGELRKLSLERRSSEVSDMDRLGQDPHFPAETMHTAQHPSPISQDTTFVNRSRDARPSSSSNSSLPWEPTRGTQFDSPNMDRAREMESSTVDRQSHLSLTLMNASRPISQPKLTPFKEIMALKHASERINTYRTTREQFAALNTGLDDWLAHMIASHPEHTASMSSPTVPTVRSSSFAGAARQKMAPSLGKFTRSSPGVTSPKPYYEQYLDSAAQVSDPSTVQPTSAVQSSAYSDHYGKGRSSGGQLQNRGKDLLQSAGLVGGKASQSAKGLFAKGKSRLRGSTDKDSPQTPAPASPQATGDKQGMRNSFRGSFSSFRRSRSSTPQVGSTYETLNRSSVTCEQESVLGAGSEPLSTNQAVRPSSVPLQRTASPRNSEALGVATEFQDISDSRVNGDRARPSWQDLEKKSAVKPGIGSEDAEGQDDQNDVRPPFQHAEVSNLELPRPLIQDHGFDVDIGFRKRAGFGASREISGTPTQAGVQERLRGHEPSSNPEFRNSQGRSYTPPARGLSGGPMDFNASQSITSSPIQVGAREPLLNLDQTKDKGPWADWPTGDSDADHSDVGPSAPLNGPESSSASSVGIYGARGVDLWDDRAFDGAPDVEASTPRNGPESSGASSVGVYGARGVDLWEERVFDGAPEVDASTSRNGPESSGASSVGVHGARGVDLWDDAALDGAPDVPSFPVPAEIESDKDLFEDAPEMITRQNEESIVPPSHVPMVDDFAKSKDHMWGAEEEFNDVADTPFSTASVGQESRRETTRSAAYQEHAPVVPQTASRPLDAMSAITQPFPSSSEPDYRQQLYTSRAYHKSREYLREQPGPYVSQIGNDSRHGPGSDNILRPTDVSQERSQVPNQSRRIPSGDLGSQDVTPRAVSSQTLVQPQRTHSRSFGGRSTGSPSSGPVARLPSGVRHGRAPSHGARTASFGPRQQDTEYELPGVGPPPMEPVTPTAKGRRSPFGRLSSRGSRDHINEAKKAQTQTLENTRINPRLVADRNGSPSMFGEDEVQHEPKSALTSHSRTPSNDLLSQFDGEVMSQRSRAGSRSDLLQQASGGVISAERTKTRSKLMRRLSSGRGPQRSPSIATPDSEGKKRTSFFGSLFGRSATVKQSDKSSKLVKDDPRSVSGPLLSNVKVPPNQSQAGSASYRHNTIGSVPSPYDMHGFDGIVNGNSAATAAATGVSGYTRPHQRSASQPLALQYNTQPAMAQSRPESHGRGAHVAYLQSQDIFPTRTQAQAAGDQVTRSLSQKAAHAAWSHPTNGAGTQQDSGRHHLHPRNPSPRPAPEHANRLSGRYADAAPNQPRRAHPPQGGQSVHPSLVNQPAYSQPLQGAKNVHPSPMNQPWLAHPPQGSQDVNPSRMKQPMYARPPQGGQSVNPSLMNQPKYTRQPQGGQSVNPSLLNQPAYDQRQQRQVSGNNGNGYGQDPQRPRITTTTLPPVRTEYGNGNQGAYYQEEEEEEEEIVMSPTFYPGQEWKPKGLEW